MSYFRNVNINNSWGGKIYSTILDQVAVSELHRLSGGVFNGTTPSTTFYETSTTASGAAAISSGELVLTTAINSGSSVLVNAKALARYMGSNMNIFRSVVRYGDVGTLNNRRYIGIKNKGTLTDGFYFLLENTTFSIGYMTGGVETLINSGSFNGEVTSFTVDTYYHTFEIAFTNKVIDFFIDDVFIHRLTETSSSIGGERHYKPFLQNTNSGVGAVTVLYSQVLTISRYGTVSSQGKYYLQQGQTTGVLLKQGPGSIHSIILSAVTNGSIITLYDGTSTGGTLIWASGSMGAQTQPFLLDFDGSGGTQFEDGLYLTVTGASCNLFVKYE